MSIIVLGNLDCDSFTVYWYCVAAVFNQISFLRRAAIVMDLIFLSLWFSEDEWGVIFCATGFSVYIFVIVCIHVINMSRKGSLPPSLVLIQFVPDIFRSFFYHPCIMLLILFVASKHSSGFPTRVTGLFAIGGGNSTCCLTTYVNKCALLGQSRPYTIMGVDGFSLVFDDRLPRTTPSSDTFQSNQ